MGFGPDRAGLGGSAARPLPSSMPTRRGNRAGRAMAFKGATYMQSALEGSWLIPNNLLKLCKLFSRPCLNSLPCGSRGGVSPRWKLIAGGFTPSSGTLSSGAAAGGQGRMRSRFSTARARAFRMWPPRHALSSLRASAASVPGFSWPDRFPARTRGFFGRLVRAGKIA